MLDGELRQATLGVTDGKITHIVDPEVTLEATERLELGGQVVLPGLVDAHVHFREPGYTEKEGVETGTAAAAAGGVTTVVEMPNTVPPVLTVDRFEEKANLFRSKSHVDYALFAAITDENLGTGDIAALADAGATAFKTFMATSFGPLLMADKGELYRAFEEVAEADRPLYIHAEDEEYLDLFGDRARAEHGEDMEAFFAARPEVAETTAVADVLDIVRDTGTETVIVHTTTADAVDRTQAAQAAGEPVWTEVTPYHLAFDQAAIERVGTHGIGTPPARDAANREALWDRVTGGDVDLFGSDHAPHELHEKERAPTDVAPGMPQLETALPFLLDAVSRQLPRCTPSDRPESMDCIHGKGRSRSVRTRISSSSTWTASGRSMPVSSCLLGGTARSTGWNSPVSRCSHTSVVSESPRRWMSSAGLVGGSSSPESSCFLSVSKGGGTDKTFMR